MKPNLTKKEDLEQNIENFVEATSKFFDEKIIEEIAREEKFCQRESKLTGHLFLSVFVFAMSIYGTPTYEQLAGLLSNVLSGMKISRQGVYDRITDNAKNFFHRILSLSIELSIPESIKLDILLTNFDRVIILDSTSFQLPDELVEFFKGSGGCATQSAIKIQFGYDLKSCYFFYELQDGTCPDNSYKNSFVNQINENDFVLRDLGYFNIDAFAEMELMGAYFLSRLYQQVTIYQKDEHGNLVEIDLVELVLSVPDDYVYETEIYIANKKNILKLRLVIEKIPEKVLNQRLRKLKRKCQREGRALTKKAKTLAGFNMFISNVDEKYLPKEHFRTLYFIRWQIELIFKSWKSNFRLEKISSEKLSHVMCCLYAKLIFIFLTTKIIRVAKIYTWIKRKKEVSEYRAHKHFKIIAESWMKAVIQDSESVKDILNNAIEFIMYSCIKCKRKEYKCPLEILEKISSYGELNSV